METSASASETAHALPSNTYKRHDKQTSTPALKSWSNGTRHDQPKRRKPTSTKATPLRIHTTCLNPDPNFTSKKNTFESRKQSQMRYAPTQPLAHMAIIDSLPTTTTAHSTKPTDHLQDNMMNNQNFIFSGELHTHSLTASPT